MQVYEHLEDAFGHWAGIRNVVAVASGTAALHLALECLQLPFGSEVITADFNMIAVARAITLAGLTPVFVDCTDDLLINPDLVDEAAATCDQVRAVVVPHIYGRRARMEEVHELARKYDLFVVEDLAEAHGVPPHPGTDAACWSYYRNKICHGEEGGAVAFTDPERAALARELRTLGFTDAHDFLHVPRGHNYRMSNVHAAIILESLARADDNLRTRRMIEGWYDRACPDEWKMLARNVVWVYDVRIPGLTWNRQARVVRALNAAGIAARMAFKPMSHQEEYLDCRTFGDGNAERLSNQILYLPVSPGVTTEESCGLAFQVIRANLD